MSAERQYVVIAGAEDRDLLTGHVPFVERHMETEFTFLDPALQILDGQEVSYQISNDGLACRYGEAELDDVASVWYRRPTQMAAEMVGVVHPAMQSYAYGNIREHWRQLYTQFPGALWVSDYYAIQRANTKSYQLAVARDLGFSIPDTLFTSSSEAAERFILERPATIVKPMISQFPAVGDDQLLFYSQRVTPEALPDFEDLKFTPLILQSAVDVDYDVRVTVVGDKIFAAGVRASVEQDQKTTIRDWRLGYYIGDLVIDPCELPEDVSDRCIALVKGLGLQFGAIDLLKTKKGSYEFLEINPNGQWAWVEEATGQSIGKAMARLLMLKPSATQ